MLRKRTSSARSLAAFAVLLLASVVCVAGKHFVMPVPKSAKSYPAHDEHPSEAVTLALDPYDMADKASIFSGHYSESGFVPIFVVLTNDGDQPISLAGMKAQLTTVDRTKMSPATEDDIYRRFTRPPSGSVSPSPLPWPRKPKGGVSKDLMEEVQNAQFAARAVEPHSTRLDSCFLTFRESRPLWPGRTFI